MVNFRFHLVSLTAVFLALTAGITIGAGVVDRATVDRIEGQLTRVEGNRLRTNAENDRLSADLDRWRNFSGEAGDRIVEGRLDGLGVFLVASTGIDRNLVDGFRSSLGAAGATLEGTLWLTARWNLADGEEARQLAGLLGATPPTPVNDLRAATIARMSGAWESGDGGPFVTALRDAGFVDFEAPATPVAPLAQLPSPGSVFVVISGDAAQVASPLLAQPLVTSLSAAGIRVLAAQPSRPPPDAARGKALPPEFVLALRADGEVSPRISTVDNLEDYRGRVAAVFALDHLRAGRTGHFGFGPGAQRLVPEGTP